MVHLHPPLQSDTTTNIWLACGDGHVDTVRALVESATAGSGSSGKHLILDAADDSGYRPIHAASSWDQLDVARYLLDAGADVHSQDADGDTALHVAESAEMARLLVEGDCQGGLCRIKNIRGWLPIDVAHHESRCDVVEYLQSVMAADGGEPWTPRLDLTMSDGEQDSDTEMRVEVTEEMLEEWRQQFAAAAAAGNEEAEEDENDDSGPSKRKRYGVDEDDMNDDNMDIPFH